MRILIIRINYSFVATFGSWLYYGFSVRFLIVDHFVGEDGNCSAYLRKILLNKKDNIILNYSLN